MNKRENSLEKVQIYFKNVCTQQVRLLWFCIKGASTEDLVLHGGSWLGQTGPRHLPSMAFHWRSLGQSQNFCLQQGCPILMLEGHYPPCFDNPLNQRGFLDLVFVTDRPGSHPDLSSIEIKVNIMKRRISQGRTESPPAKLPFSFFFCSIEERKQNKWK